LRNFRRGDGKAAAWISADESNKKTGNARKNEEEFGRDANGQRSYSL